MDVDARIQLFDLKTNYTFQTIPGIANYNMPLYNVQVEPGPQNISYYPIYQGFSQPAYVNGIQVPFYTEQNAYWNLWPNYTQFLNPAAVGNGTAGPYTISLAQAPAIPGHLDMTGFMAYLNQGNTNQDPPFIPDFTFLVSSGLIQIPSTSIYPGVYFTATTNSGHLIQVCDSGFFLSSNGTGDLYGLLITPNLGSPPFGYAPLSGGYSTSLNTVNYADGTATVTFPESVPVGNPINAECLFFQPGLPRSVLFYNNTLTIRPPPDISYNVQLQAYLTPAAFLNTSYAIPFGYMAEYIARGAARKILSDTGDAEQFQFYEPLFHEQETLVWKRSQRQFTATRTGTIFSDLQGQTNFNQIGASN